MRKPNLRECFDQRPIKAAGMTGLALLLCLVLTAASCEPDDLTAARETQQAVMSTAVNAVPPYQPTEFPAREDINRYLRETETPGEWYTYALNWAGEPIFYVVSDGKPRNICVSITSPDRYITNSGGAVVLSAPALDGVYYGGANCNSWYLWDASTGNYIEVAGQAFTLLSTKAPLRLETDPILLSWDQGDGTGN